MRAAQPDILSALCNWLSSFGLSSGLCKFLSLKSPTFSGGTNRGHFCGVLLQVLRVGDLLGLHQQLQPGDGVSQVRIQTKVSFCRLFASEADHCRRPAQLLWADGETHPEVSPIHPPAAGPPQGIFRAMTIDKRRQCKSAGDATGPPRQDGFAAGTDHPGVSGRDAQREEEGVRAGGSFPSQAAVDGQQTWEN